ncbi:MAG: hypothetical protein Q4F83_01050 [Eubacteriales bacterium]|nr:hypothetical protein [Eubacteriales bacterium]
MGLYQRFVSNTRKPKGLSGRLMVAGMNSGHAALANWGCRFLIVNESIGTDKTAVKYAKIINGMNLYTPERLKELLSAAGFAGIETFQAEHKPWLAVLARKAR